MGEISDDELSSLMAPTKKLDGETDRSHAKRIFEVNAGAIAQGLVEVALYSNSDSIRLRASQYCIDRVLGNIASVSTGPSADDALMDLVKQFSGVED